MIVPFVKLYTDGVTDIEYFIKGLPLLFTLINLLSGVRATSALLITVSGNAGATKNRSIIEAVINLVSSIVLVNILGIKGVLYGTIIALLYRSNDIIIYTGQRRLARNLLRDVVGRYVGNEPDSIFALNEIQKVAALMKFELERGNIEEFANLLTKMISSLVIPRV